MALMKTVNMSEVPNLDKVPDNPAFSLHSTHFLSKASSPFFKSPKFTVIGHRGNGMNSSDPKLKSIKEKENSLLSFNAAAAFDVDFVELDVQVTKDDIPIIFHDDFILTQENGTLSEKRVTEITLAEFLCYGPQREPATVGKSLFRKGKDGSSYKWEVENDDTLCTLQEAFQKVNSSLGFNIELKFDDYFEYKEQEIFHVLEAIWRVVVAYAKERPIIFSTFQPDAAGLIRKLQKTYPVFFLTDGGIDLYNDVRRNSLDEAIKLSLENDLQGIVSEVEAIFRHPEEITTIKGSNLSLFTYGKLNNVEEAVYLQHLMGIDGVIVDFVKEIVDAVSDITKPRKDDEEDNGCEENGQKKMIARSTFSELELSFLQKLIAQLLQ